MIAALTSLSGVRAGGINVSEEKVGQLLKEHQLQMEKTALQSVATITESFKTLLKKQGLVFDGKILNTKMDNIDGPSINYNDKWEEFLWNIMNVVNEPVTVIIIPKTPKGA